MYKYKKSIWGAVYRVKDDGSLPEQYVVKEGAWKETDEAFDAFYNGDTSDYSSIPEEYALRMVKEYEESI